MAMRMTDRGTSLLAVGASLFAAYGSVYVASTSSGRPRGVLFALVAMAAGFLAAGAFYVLYGLFVGGPRIVMSTCSTHGSRPEGRTEHAYVKVANKHRPGRAPAEHVHARITFQDPLTGFEHVLQHARWSHTQQMPPIEATLVSTEITIPANGSEWLLDAAFKYLNESKWYGFDNENYYASAGRCHELGGEVLRVRVEVFGSNCTASQEFKLQNGGVGGVLTWLSADAESAGLARAEEPEVVR